MSGDNETVLCTEGACAKSVEFLFSATHTSEWRNVSQLLSDLLVPAFVRRRLGGAGASDEGGVPGGGEADGGEADGAGGGGYGTEVGERRGAMDDPTALPDWLFRAGMSSFGQLSVRLG